MNMPINHARLAEDDAARLAAGAPASLVSDAALARARDYIGFCVRNGFHPGIEAEALLAPEVEEVPRLSPFFEPAFYARAAQIDGGGGVNPYLHYFQVGWRRNLPVSRLVDRLHLRRQGWTAPEGAPLLNAVIRQVERDDRFSCHALFDPAFYRRYEPRARASAMIEFLRRRAAVPFSPYVDLAMLDRATAAMNARSRNALVCLLEAPVGADANPMFFSGWYAERYGRGRPGAPADRDMLSDYLLIGLEKGFLPSPFALQDCGVQDDARAGAPSRQQLLDYLSVSHWTRSGEVQTA